MRNCLESESAHQPLFLFADQCKALSVTFLPHLLPVFSPLRIRFPAQVVPPLQPFFQTGILNAEDLTKLDVGKPKLTKKVKNTKPQWTLVFFRVPRFGVTNGI